MVFVLDCTGHQWTVTDHGRAIGYPWTWGQPWLPLLVLHDACAAIYSGLFFYRWGIDVVVCVFLVVFVIVARVAIVMLSPFVIREQSR